MEPIEIDIQLNYRDVKRAFIFASFKNGRSALTLEQNILFALIGLLAVFSLINSKGTLSIAIFSSIAAIMVLSLISSIIFRIKLKKIWNENTVWHSPIRLLFSDFGVKTESIFGKSEVSWESYNKVTEDEEFILLHHPNTAFQIIPKSSFKDKDLITAFKNSLKEKIKGKISFFEPPKKGPLRRKLFSK